MSAGILSTATEPMPSVSFGPSAFAAVIFPSFTVMLTVIVPGPPKPSAVAVPVTLPSEAVSALGSGAGAGAGAGAAATAPKSAGLRPAAVNALSAAWRSPVEVSVAPVTPSTLMLFLATISPGIDSIALEPMPSVSLGPCAVTAVILPSFTVMFTVTASLPPKPSPVPVPVMDALAFCWVMTITAMITTAETSANTRFFMVILPP